MITSTRIGRHGNLCNSMFQFAAVLGMAKKTGLDIAVPHNKTYHDYNYGRTNTSIFDGFDISTTILESNNHKFKEVEFPFYYTDHKADDFTDMIGHFQSEKYFENAEQEIKKQFKFNVYEDTGNDTLKHFAVKLKLEEDSTIYADTLFLQRMSKKNYINQLHKIHLKLNYKH